MKHFGAIKQNPTLLGITMIVAAVFLLSLADALIKWLSLEMTLWQLFVARSVIAVPLCLLVLRSLGQALAIGSGNGRWVLLRCLLLVTAWVALYASLPLLPLPVVAAALYTAPLFIALLSAIFVGEAVGLQRGSALMIGFSGVLVIVKPGSESFSAAVLLPLLGAVCYALAMIITRARCQREDPFVLSFYLNASMLVCGLIAGLMLMALGPSPGLVASNVFLFGGWMPLGGKEWGLLAVLALIMVCAAAASAKAYQSGAPSIVATFDYSYLLFAVFWSALFFADFPDAATLTGMAMIFGAGVLVLRAPVEQGAKVPTAARAERSLD